MNNGVNKKFICGIFVVVFFCSLTVKAFSAKVDTVDFGGETWTQIKDKHFIVYYDSHWPTSKAQNVLRLAEDYYRRIGDMLGFTRYDDFWTWDQRAKIFIFPSQEAFVQRTGAPMWSMGYSDRDSFLFQSRAIVTYQQEKNILDGLLPHEISHLILHDNIVLSNLPVWIDEGISQLHEPDKFKIADKYMYVLVTKNQYVRLNFLNSWDIRKEKDNNKVEVFYAQSLSVVRFLKTRYGTGNFKRFCRNLRDGKTVNEALSSAYSGSIRSLQDLEKVWVNYIKNLY